MSDQITARTPARPASGNKNKILMRGLNFYYGEFHALKEINLNISAGQVTAFIGPSGCGKSTLLRVLNRMYDLYPGQRAEGEVLLDGETSFALKGRIAEIGGITEKIVVLLTM